MTKLRLSLEISGLVAFCVITIFVLSFTGKSRVAFSASQKFTRISEPRDAYRLWEENKVYGRVLFYFGRHLPVDATKLNPAQFAPNEFRNDDARTALCNKIRDHEYSTSVDASQNCGDFLNYTVLRDRYFAARWLGRNNIVLPKKINQLIEISQGYENAYSSLREEQKIVINTLNRRILEFTYPDLCPKSGDFAFSINNFVFAGVTNNMFRKIYHIVPEKYWFEDRIRYTGYAGAQVAPYTVRSYYYVPIITLTLRKLRPLGEKVIVAVAEKDWDKEEFYRILGLVDNNTFQSDLVTLH